MKHLTKKMSQKTKGQATVIEETKCQIHTITQIMLTV